MFQERKQAKKEALLKPFAYKITAQIKAAKGRPVAVDQSTVLQNFVAHWRSPHFIAVHWSGLGVFWIKINNYCLKKWYI
ncbi:hypothetical protein D7322_01480 [Sphingobacterium puteale]|uniref:Uncharacterized protein n=1 Tax=Sphingobacterium puteale TaxID=2420510 RepID=A0A420W467_9SPHI|nr:hypothetical protein D7322_01480 [Sphingobacterium puteale]